MPSQTERTYKFMGYALKFTREDVSVTSFSATWGEFQVSVARDMSLKAKPGGIVAMAKKTFPDQDGSVTLRAKAIGEQGALKALEGVFDGCRFGRL